MIDTKDGDGNGDGDDGDDDGDGELEQLKIGFSGRQNTPRQLENASSYSSRRFFFLCKKLEGFIRSTLARTHEL